MKVCLETFGCRLNRAEALAMEAAFLARGWTRTARHDNADLIVVRGCAVTARAESDTVRMVEHLREKYPLKRVVVTGCVRERRNERWLKDLDTENAPVPDRTARAYLKVQDGCAGSCAFCTVPRFRGRPASVPSAQVLERARRFIGAGYRELVVTGCNLVLYDSDGMRLDGLVRALAALDPGCRVRLGSVEPSPAAADVVRAMAECPNACRFLHIPLQSASNRILTAMRRGYLARDVDATVALAASLMPEIGLGCDLMSGFPGETDIDHLATASFLRRHPFTNAHVFPYSERPGTLAATLPDALPRELRHARARELSAIAQEKRAAFARRFRHRKVRVLVEEENGAAGWTSEYLWFEAPGFKAPRRSQIEAVVRETDGDTLLGMPV